ncbi:MULTISPECIES: voltage-gated chloride channel family protein [Myroides]|uniref:Chloride channel protein n=1 Tax=Myroides albus TaxID=2562892 RepID=A0A6I3LGU1_9FLAO|nr:MULTISPECIES: voltage-gated chloride channel family protein [Myroides]MTG97708.1 chloride channel protein [Myroides albus]MVX34822.1 chloride channel protein [Myroides sp. LoEW2-1]UVD78746.1 voltage-gated chloride channel family protein [Myroides albus]
MAYHFLTTLKAGLSKKNIVIYFVKWTILSAVIGSFIGTTSALFLYLLEHITEFRSHHIYLLYFLPIAGFLIGLLYYYYAGRANKGNNLLIDEYYTPKAIIPFKMAPLVLLGTLVTHLFGGSAGREGTAIQMGGAIADQFSRLFSLFSIDRKTILLIGVSAGFASVFGTPIAGTLFALELMLVGRVKYKYVYPVLLSAVIAHIICLQWGITHTAYKQNTTLPFDLLSIAKVSLTGVAFGLAAIIFIKLTDFCNKTLTKHIVYPPLRPLIGGTIFVLLILIIGDFKYLGLGVPTIEESFFVQQSAEVFLLKIVFTAITLGAGFKGGEVTPLFFIGATLGSFLSIYLNIPVDILAAIGFVAVFAGATKTPWACTLMAIELFGIENALYFALACYIAYQVSGRQSIYKSQKWP